MAQQRLMLVINGYYFTEAVNRLGYHIEYEDRAGKNTTKMLNGDEYPDIIDERPVITWPLNALWDSELAALYAALNNRKEVYCYYWDTKTGAIAEGWFRGKITGINIGLIDDRGVMSRDGAVLTLRAR